MPVCLPPPPLTPHAGLGEVLPTGAAAAWPDGCSGIAVAVAAWLGGARQHGYVAIAAWPGVGSSMSRWP